MTEALAALAAAHKLGVLHRDIKPSNILLQDDGHTKITDFGIAKSFDVRTGAEGMTDDMTITGVVLGTPGYLAPGTEIGPPGHGAVRPLLGRRRHGGGTHGVASRSRCHPDGGATALTARRRPSSTGDRAERAVRVGGGDAARPAASSSDGRRGTAGHDAADGTPAGRDPPGAGR